MQKTQIDLCPHMALMIDVGYKLGVITDPEYALGVLRDEAARAIGGGDKFISPGDDSRNFTHVPADLVLEQAETREGVKAAVLAFQSEVRLVSAPDGTEAERLLDRLIWAICNYIDDLKDKHVGEDVFSLFGDYWQKMGATVPSHAA